MPARALIVFGVQLGEDGELEPLAVTSREMLQCERQWKGFNAQEFFGNVSILNLYKVAYVVLRFRGDERVPRGMTFDDFIDEWSVSLGDPRTQSQPGDGEFVDEPDEVGSEANPTAPAA